MYRKLDLDEESINKFLWIMMHQYGLKIDDITETGDVYATVPSFSDYTAKQGVTLPGFQRPVETKFEMVAGETLRQMCCQIFDNVGLTPHIGIRTENWNEFLGDLNAKKAQAMINQDL